MGETFSSEIKELGVVDIPRPGGTRVMMMPFRFEDVHSIPDDIAGQPVGRWREPVARIVGLLQQQGLGPETGVGYLTVDEARVPAGTTHRRPGLHVDGIGPDGKSGGPWGSGGGPWGKHGMVLLASHTACRGWTQEFQGSPGPNGDCAHLKEQLDAAGELPFAPNQAYWCGALAVHESLPLPVDTDRQLCRVSLPSDAPWYAGYTENPLGVLPGGQIHDSRAEFMSYRS